MISLKDPTDIASLRFGQLVSVLGTLGQLTEEDEEADDGEARMKAKLQGIYEKSSPQGGEIGQLELAIHEFLDQKEKIIKMAEGCRVLADRMPPVLKTTAERNYQKIDSLCKGIPLLNSVVLFAGDSSAGKSTLINLLLGSELLPASPMPCTSTICEIRYSEQRKAEIHKANTEVEVVELGDAPAKDLLPYLCLEGEERFVLNPYIKVVVHFPAPLLKGGLVLVDSPGFGDNELLTAMTTAYLSESSCLVCVSNSTRAHITLPFANFLSTLFEREARVADPLVVLSKWSLVDLEDQEKVKKSFVRSLREVWPAVPESAFAQFDSQVALQFQEIFPGRTSPQEELFQKVFTDFVQATLAGSVNDVIREVKAELLEICTLLTIAVRQSGDNPQKVMEKKKKSAKATMEEAARHLNKYSQQLKDYEASLEVHIKQSREAIQDAIRANFKEEEAESHIYDRIKDCMEIWEEKHQHLEKLKVKIEDYISVKLHEAFETEASWKSALDKFARRLRSKKRREAKSVRPKESKSGQSPSHDEQFEAAFAKEKLSELVWAYIDDVCPLETMKLKFNEDFVEGLRKFDDFAVGLEKFEKEGPSVEGCHSILADIQKLYPEIRGL